MCGMSTWIEHGVYLRISGLHEKESFYELYDKQPAFVFYKKKGIHGSLAGEPT